MLARFAPKRLRLVLPSAALLLCATPGVIGVASCAATTASAGATTLYAYAAGGATSPTSCLQSTTTSQQCTLAGALSLAKAGDSVALATPDNVAHYVGNWSVATSGTSSSAPLTIKPATGVTNPVLDGNHGESAGCQTKACNGPVLTIGSKVHVDISGLTIQDGDNTLDGYGGAIQNDAGGTLSVSACTFSNNTADDGGAIDNADDSTGTVTVSGSTFTANSASGGGGAINSGDNGGTGTLAVSASKFSGNSAYYGGAIVNGNGTASVSGSAFSANTADYAAALDNGDAGTGTLTVSASTFSANRAKEDGGAIMNGWTGHSGTVIVSASTFLGNSAAGDPNDPYIDKRGPNGYGGAIDNNGTGTLAVSASTFSANTAKNGGDTISNFHLVWTAADIFDGSCYEVSGASWDDQGYNVASGATCLNGGTADVNNNGSLTSLLGTLADNGGPTYTMLPLVGNPAMSVIPLNTTVKLNGTSVTLCPAIDQRGVHSSAGKACNAGAVQSPAP